MDDDYGYEPYENDLEQWGNNEAWEDAQADMRSDAARDEHTKDILGLCEICGKSIYNWEEVLPNPKGIEHYDCERSVAARGFSYDPKDICNDCGYHAESCQCENWVGSQEDRYLDQAYEDRYELGYELDYDN